MFPGELINSSKQGPARQHRGTHWGKRTVSTLRTELVMKLLCTNVNKSLYIGVKSTNFLKKLKMVTQICSDMVAEFQNQKSTKNIYSEISLITISLFEIFILTKSIQKKLNWELHFNFRKLISLPQTVRYQNPLTFHVK